MTSNALSPASEKRLCDLYREKRFGFCDLAIIFGVSPGTVRNVLTRNAVPLNQRGENLKKAPPAKPWNDDFVSYHRHRAITRRKAR